MSLECKVDHKRIGNLVTRNMENVIWSNCLMPARRISDKESTNLNSELLLNTSRIKSEPDEDQSQDKIVMGINHTIGKCKSIETARDSEDTASAVESDEATLTADNDSDRNIDSDSTVFNDAAVSRRKRRRRHFKIKDEPINTEEDNNVRASEIIKSVQIPQISLPQSEYTIKNCSSGHSKSEIFTNKIKNIKQESDTSNTEATNEDESNVSARPVIAINKNIPLLHLNLPNQITNLTKSDCGVMVSLNSTLCVNAEAGNDGLIKEKLSKLSTVSEEALRVPDNPLTNSSFAKNYSKTLTTSKENNMCDKYTKIALPVTSYNNKTTSIHAKMKIPRDLLEMFKIFCNFDKRDIEDCLNHIIKSYPQKEEMNLFYCSTGTKITPQSKETNILPTVNAKVQKLPSNNEMSSSVPLTSNKSQDVCTEKSKSPAISVSKVERSKKLHQSETFSRPALYNIEECVSACYTGNIEVSTSSSTNLQDEIVRNSQSQHSTSGSDCNKGMNKSSHKEAITSAEGKSNGIKINDQNNCFQHSYAENDDEDNSIRFARIMSEVISTCEASKNNNTQENINTQYCAQSSKNITPLIIVKTEKTDSMTVPDTLESNHGHTLVLNSNFLNEKETHAETASIPNYAQSANGISISIPAIKIKSEKIDSTTVTDTLESDQGLSLADAFSPYRTQSSSLDSINSPIIKIKKEKDKSMAIPITLKSGTGHSSVELSSKFSSEEKTHRAISSTSYHTQSCNANNICIPVKIKEEIDLETISKLQESDFGHSLVELSSKFPFKEKRTSQFPSKIELKNIIETVSSLSSSQNESRSLHSHPTDSPPEIEIIVLDCDDTPSVVNCNSLPVISTDEVEILAVKKKKRKTQTTNRSSCSESITGNTTGMDKDVPKFQNLFDGNGSGAFCDLTERLNSIKKEKKDIQIESNTEPPAKFVRESLKEVAEVDGEENRKSTSFQLNVVDIIDETRSNKISKNNTEKTKTVCEFSKKADSDVGLKSNMMKNNERTLNQFNDPNNDLRKKINAIELKKIAVQDKSEDEPPAKKIKTTSTTCEENLVKQLNMNKTIKKSLAANDKSGKDKIQFAETNVPFPETCISVGKRRIENGTEIKKKVKLTSEVQEHFEKSQAHYIEKSNLKRASHLDRMSVAEVLNQRSSPIHPPISSPSAASKKPSNSSDNTFNNMNVDFLSSTVYKNKYIKSPIPNSETSSSDASNLFPKQPEERNHEVCQENCVSSSSDQNWNVNSGKQIQSDTRILQSNRAPIIFLGRRGKNSASSTKCLHKNVGKQFMGMNDLPSLILEWNPNWLLTQIETNKCPPICDRYVCVKDSYESELDFYNTIFPLHLLSIWLEISDMSKKNPNVFESVLENQVEKPNFVKITLLSVFYMSHLDYQPKREDIVVCEITKSDGSVESLFALVCNVISEHYNAPPNSDFESKVMRKVKFELFCAEILNAPLLSKVKVQILFNIRIALLQNDALCRLSSSQTVMKNIILDPKKNLPRWKFLSLPSQDDNTYYNKCLRNIFDSVTSRTVRITVVDTHHDAILAIFALVNHLKQKERPILIGLKSEESFLKLAKRLKDCNLILAVRTADVELPEDLRKFAIEVRSTECSGHGMFSNWHVTLTLLSSVFFGDFSSAFVNQNLTGILHDAHLCTEAETALLLYYDVKQLVLMGNQQAQPDIHPFLKHFGYNISLFNRFCKASDL